jgi:hypothetical protein
MKKEKNPRLSGIKERVIYRDSMRRFATRENSVSEEYWKYREAIVKGKKKKVDIKIEALSYAEGETSWFPSIQIPEKGSRAGKLSAVLGKTLKETYVLRTDSRISISMTAKTSRGKIIKRKLSFYHYNKKKLHEHTIGGIINELFYKHGDRPAYDIKIVKGWRGRQTTKKETLKRRQLHNVTFQIEATVESRKSKKAKARKKK